MTSLEGVKDKCYIFRAYESPDGSVKNATGLLPCPLLQTNGLMKSCSVAQRKQMILTLRFEQKQESGV